MNPALLEMINKSEMPFSKLAAVLEESQPEVEPQDLSGKVIIVTGANVGIGYETAKAIASMKPKKLIMACRNSDKAKEALKTIQDETKFSDIEAWDLDLASFASVQAFAARFLATGLPLDVLCSNAGVGAGLEYITTDDGYEITIQVNHIANALLISSLHPALKKAADARKDHSDHFPRVVVVASDVHFWPTSPTSSDPHPVQTAMQKPEGEYNGFFYYPASKLLNVLFAKAYAARCPDPIWICSSNPGYTTSQLGMKNPKTGAPIDRQRPSHLKIRTTYEGAKTIITNSISPKMGASGGYYSELVEKPSRQSTLGEEGKRFADNVWNDTLEILKKHVKETTIYNW